MLCTQSQTLAIKTVETTNSVWLVQPDQVRWKHLEGEEDGEGTGASGLLVSMGSYVSS